MVNGRRARKVRGSPHSGRPNRWGASATGVCQCALRACCMRCRGFTPARIEVRQSAGSNARHAPTWTKMHLSSRTSAVNSMPRRDPREIPSTKTWTDNA
jgi:predicted phage tail protein